MNEIKLKPCPFCGGEAVINHCNNNNSVYIECSNCYVRTVIQNASTTYCARDKVIKLWNRRIEATEEGMLLTVDGARGYFPENVIISAIEKQIPKKPLTAEKQDIRYVTSYICPSCGEGFTGTGVSRFCYHCGQALDWSEED